MKVSMIVLAIALTACGTKNSQSTAAAVEDVEILNERVAKLEAELDAKNNEVQAPSAPEIKTEEVKKPAITQDEIWANEDKAATFYGSNNGYSTYYLQRTYKNENNDPIRVFYTKIEAPSYTYSTIRETQWSYKHSIWLTIRSQDPNTSYTVTFDEAEKAYEAFKAKQGA